MIEDIITQTRPHRSRSCGDLGSGYAGGGKPGRRRRSGHCQPEI